MKRILALGAFGLVAACQTPGYDYVSRAAPNFPEALEYTDVVAGRFGGPAGEVAEQEFGALIRSAELEGQPWFVVLDPDQPQGIYEGDVVVTSYRGEIRRETERKCVEWDGPFDCEHHAIVEKECVKDLVDVDVRARLTDLANRRLVFASAKGGTSEREDCYDVAEYPDTGQPTGKVGSTLHEIYSSYDAPYGMIAEAVPEAVRLFRFDIAPYMASFRAEIVTNPLSGEEKGDARFAAAVKATKGGNFLGACAQWEELAAAYPASPGILHNSGACAEARGDMAGAHSQYARAAELAKQIPLLKDKDAKVIFDALARVNRGRRENTLIDKAIDVGGS
jgi:hypothetical protein